MPRLYLAKINVNSSIFDVYKDQKILKKIKNDVFRNLSNESSYSVETTAQSSSKEKKQFTKSVYQLAEIEKHDGLSLPLELDFEDYGDGYNEWKSRVITGKMIRTFNKHNEKYNEKSKSVEATETNESYSIQFFFDVDNELLTFRERRNFGYSQFMDAFTFFLNESVKNSQYPTDFKIYFQKDQDALDEKLNNLHAVGKVRATLIPFNPNSDDLQELANELLIQKQMKQMNATEVTVEYSSSNDNLDMESNAMKDIKDSISHGYGKLWITGKDANGKETRINTNTDVAFSTEIPEKLGDNDFNRESVNMIRRFFKKIHKQKIDI